MPEKFLKAYLNATTEQRNAAFVALTEHGDERKANADHDFVMTRTEAAKVLSCSAKTVSRYAARGVIRAVRLGANGRRASNGYSAKSVYAAIERVTNANGQEVV